MDMEYKGNYVPLGNSGLKVSQIAFGCGFRGTPPEREAVYVITEAIEHGINFIDCANIYTIADNEKSEIALGKALKGRRDKAIITSKVGSWVKKDDQGPNGYGGSRYHILREIDNSLRRLDTDHIDVYLLHQPDPTTPPEETMRAMETLVNQGKIRYVGVCNYDAWQVVTALDAQHRINAQPLIAMQNPYNLLNRTLEAETFPMARHHGVGIMAYGALASGLLGGRYVPGQPMPPQSFWARSPLYREYYPHLFCGQVVEVVNKVKAVSEKYGVTMAQVATAWVLTHPEVSCVVAGANTWEDFEDSISAASLKLEAEDVKELNRVSYGLQENFTLPHVTAVMERIREE